MWKKVKAWIIHKFGGKTQEEYDVDIKNFKAEYDTCRDLEFRTNKIRATLCVFK